MKTNQGKLYLIDTKRLLSPWFRFKFRTHCMVWFLAAQEHDDSVRNIEHGIQQPLRYGIVIVGLGQLQGSHAIAVQGVHIGSINQHHLDLRRLAKLGGHVQRRRKLVLMVVVGIGPLHHQAQRCLQIACTHTGMELPAQFLLQIACNGGIIVVLETGFQDERQIDVLGLDEVRLSRVQGILGRGLAPAGQVLAPRRVGAAVQKMVFPHAIRAVGVQRVDEIQHRRFPVPLAQGLHYGDVPSQAAVNGAAVGTE